MRLYQVYTSRVQACHDGTRAVNLLPTYDAYVAEVRRACSLAHAPARRGRKLLFDPHAYIH
jgi:hypothetical protein